VIDYRFGDFTEGEYRELVAFARRHWRFVMFGDGHYAERFCLWRHDIDLSVQRALALGRIEAELGVRATYLIHLHSFFYNALEADSVSALRALRGWGHEIGLHLDLAFLARLSNSLDSDALRGPIEAERELLAQALGARIQVVSVHNPDSTMPDWVWEESICGMVNASSLHFRDGCAYCSDSNGYWRHERLRDVLERGSDERLHVLTHPGWWVPGPMSPRKRVQRCIDGRAVRAGELYDEFMDERGRTNVA
jgi:hypothetical protein